MTTDHDPQTVPATWDDETEGVWQALAATRRAKVDELRAAARCVDWRGVINSAPPEELRAIVRDVFASLLDENERGGLTYMGVDVRWWSLDRIENEILAARDRLHGGPR